MNIRHALTLALALIAAPAQAALYTYGQTPNQLIPDNHASGYASTINVSGFAEEVTNEILDVNVRLTISGGWNGDLYVFLVHNNSTTSILLNRVGRRNVNPDGFGDAGFDIWLNDGAASDIHEFGTGGSPLTGVWQPDGRRTDPNDVGNGGSRNAMLNVFNGQNPNGSWSLFVADVSGGYESTLVSWDLEIQTVPEPVTVALGVFGGVLGLAGFVRWLRRPRPWD